jgi:hypothetical protein
VNLRYEQIEYFRRYRNIPYESDRPVRPLLCPCKPVPGEYLPRTSLHLIPSLTAAARVSRQ